MHNDDIHPPHMLTPAEAYRIGGKSILFMKSLPFLDGMIELFGAHPINQNSEWNLRMLLFDVWNAGRVYGIRQERIRRGRR